MFCPSHSSKLSNLKWSDPKVSRDVGEAWESEFFMSKDKAGIAQAILDAIWKAMGRPQAHQPSMPKVKLDGRRGYGDNEIPSPAQSPDKE